MSLEEIEKSIIKKYRRELWSRFVHGINDFDMVKENDKIAVCISGGKDSMLLAKCFQELKRHSKFHFDLEFIVMNPGYTEENLQKIKENLQILNIPAIIFDSDVFDVSLKLDQDSPCYMCARMRRGCLYNKAKELGCNKIALGHHFNDAIETILLNVLYAGEYKAMMPKLHSTNFSGMELIRPLYYVKEIDIIHWAKWNQLEFLDCACKVTKSKQNGKRQEIKELIYALCKKNKNIDINIMRSSENVNIDAILGVKQNGKYRSFLDDYDKEDR